MVAMPMRPAILGNLAIIAKHDDPPGSEGNGQGNGRSAAIAEGVEALD